MDTRLDIREIVKRILREYAEIKPSYGDIETEVIFDDAHGKRLPHCCFPETMNDMRTPAL